MHLYCRGFDPEVSSFVDQLPNTFFRYRTEVFPPVLIGGVPRCDIYHTVLHLRRKFSQWNRQRYMLLLSGAECGCNVLHAKAWKIPPLEFCNVVNRL